MQRSSRHAPASVSSGSIRNNGYARQSARCEGNVELRFWLQDKFSGTFLLMAKRLEITNTGKLQSVSFMGNLSSRLKRRRRECRVEPLHLQKEPAEAVLSGGILGRFQTFHQRICGHIYETSEQIQGRSRGDYLYLHFEFFWIWKSLVGSREFEYLS